MKVVVFGATGVVGRAAVDHFAATGACDVVAVSRRPLDLPGVVHVSVDLGDEAAAAQAIASPTFDGTTHVVFAALQESADLAQGWQDTTLMARNLDLFRNALGPLVAEQGATLRHVSLLQGAKAYGLHLGRSPVPAKERAPRDRHDNFYFLQEDALRSLAEGAAWSWTVLRPQIVFGESFGSPMNLVPAIGVFAALERARGRALSFPGRATRRARSRRRATAGAGAGVGGGGRRRAQRDLQRDERRRVLVARRVASALPSSSAWRSATRSRSSWPT